MYYKLVDLFDLQMGKTPDRNNPVYWNSGVNKWISIADLSKCNKYIVNTSELISDTAVDEIGIKKIPKETVVMSFKLSIGKLAITEEPMFSNEAIMAFIDKGIEKIEPSYIYYLFMHKDWNEGTNKAFLVKTLNKATLSQIEINLHDYQSQLEIVRVLDNVQHIIDSKKQQIDKLDLLIKSRFVEMFGDPISNSRRLAELTLPELGEFGRGVSKHRPRNAPELLGGEYPLIQTGDVANTGLYIKQYESTYSELGLQQSKMWNAGTLCITIAANIAKTSILTFDACFPDSVVGFNANEKTNNIFIHYWFSFFQEILEAQAPESAQKNINLKTLSELKVIIPKISLQKEFVEFVEQVDKSKSIFSNKLSSITFTMDYNKKYVA